jgi:hypothetical protein
MHMSLASSRTVFVTAIRLAPGREDVCGITAVRWCADGGRSEEASAADLGLWLTSGQTRAFVRWDDGTTGPELRAVRCPELCVGCGSVAKDDALLTLPQFGRRARRRKLLASGGTFTPTFTLRASSSS